MTDKDREIRHLEKKVRELKDEVSRLNDLIAKQEDEGLMQGCMVTWQASEIQRLREERRWRDAEEEWPAGTEWCLCRYRAPTELSVLWFDGHGDWKDFDGEVQYPLHWMPLPEPPTKET